LSNSPASWITLWRLSLNYQVGEYCIVGSDGVKVGSKTIVVATYARVLVDQTCKTNDKQEAYRTYVIGAQIDKPNNVGKSQIPFIITYT